MDGPKVMYEQRAKKNMWISIIYSKDNVRISQALFFVKILIMAKKESSVQHFMLKRALEHYYYQIKTTKKAKMRYATRQLGRKIHIIITN